MKLNKKEYQSKKICKEKKTTIKKIKMKSNRKQMEDEIIKKKLSQII